METGQNILSQPAKAFSSLLAPNTEPNQARHELKDPGDFLWALLLTLRAPPRTLKAGSQRRGHNL